MTDPAFIVTEAETWLRRGRTRPEAEALAKAWREFPDLLPSEPLERRMARTRARVNAMRPIFDAMARRTEAERQAKNFAFTSGRIDDGHGDDRDRAILRGARKYGYDWDASVHYADGWYAAHAGWSHRGDLNLAYLRKRETLKAAYDQGFKDGGGDQADLFDQARRALRAQLPSGAASQTQHLSRSLPSAWPKPSDGERPCSWNRRAIILSEADEPWAQRRGRQVRSALEIVRELSHGLATIIVVSARSGIVVNPDEPAAFPAPITPAEADALIADPCHRETLRTAFRGHLIDDILVAVRGEELRVIDALADALPICRSMERTRNTPLQQRAHLATWLERGVAPGENLGAGHIRWSKRSKGLTGKLGEFTARYAGPAPGIGHMLNICIEDGTLAHGFVTSNQVPLDPKIEFTNKAHLRREMVRALRAFGAATRLAAPGLFSHPA